MNKHERLGTKLVCVQTQYALSYLLQLALAVSGEVTAHEHTCSLPLQYSKGEQQPHEGVILTGVNDQLVPHLGLSHVPALLLRTVLQTVFQHLKDTTTVHLVCARLDLDNGKGNFNYMYLPQIYHFNTDNPHHLEKCVTNLVKVV